SWQAGGRRVGHGEVNRLIKEGKVKPEETSLFSRDVESGRMIEIHRGSVAWNEYRKRWIQVFAAAAGEVWYSEAKDPNGPWLLCQRVAVHGDYNFYNPMHHPLFDQESGRVIYFQGTYTDSFSNAKSKTPRY